ncbi:Myb-like DNA-binding domain containing protein [Trichomonas vaginalis G3]|uniref:Myb-like DNA-binding domain containing protein n=1 Tax=Trichomonas vaginalis (strain ATCC PRA-98 / G3) TaxID=412133 RepID=A2DZM4_TRIV3|nr:RNA polymerase II transcription regulator recruiting protein [Trichomonas vaginalis G3]EAY14092.1 Myb-like DNA-binding domain containing protein [Trichomonas vaginalis G3]KAI5525102.1 RNA polymerase II transcription regulator recruiting protein [Trichomonas vaginalis G3]|eukprot:XP_001326315.1 Myb-like DNA-binding domain containing protein [Trichomonas vaginalis G3]
MDTGSNSNMLSTRCKAKFTPEDDKKLLYYVDKLGTNKWFEVSICMGNKTTRQCRERYKTYLAPNISHETWTPEDDHLLMNKYNEFGSKWSAISKFFTNRTGIAVKNRCHVLLRKIKKEIKKATMISKDNIYVHQEDTNKQLVPEEFTIVSSPESSDHSFDDFSFDYEDTFSSNFPLEF